MKLTRTLVDGKYMLTVEMPTPEDVAAEDRERLCAELAEGLHAFGRNFDKANDLPDEKP